MQRLQRENNYYPTGRRNGIVQRYYNVTLHYRGQVQNESVKPCALAPTWNENSTELTTTMSVHVRATVKIVKSFVPPKYRTYVFATDGLFSIRYHIRYDIISRRFCYFRLTIVI